MGYEVKPSCIRKTPYGPPFIREAVLPINTFSLYKGENTKGLDCITVKAG